MRLLRLEEPEFCTFMRIYALKIDDDNSAERSYGERESEVNARGLVGSRWVHEQPSRYNTCPKIDVRNS